PLVTDGPTNSMSFTGDPLGDVLLRGPGAGGGPTASAVFADVLAALAGAPGHRPIASTAPVPDVPAHHGECGELPAPCAVVAPAVTSRRGLPTPSLSVSNEPGWRGWLPTAGSTFRPGCPKRANGGVRQDLRPTSLPPSFRASSSS